MQLVVGACGPNGRSGGGPEPDGGAGGDGGEVGCGGVANCYSVYAHADHVLYVIDLQSKGLKDTWMKL